MTRLRRLVRRLGPVAWAGVAWFGLWGPVLAQEAAPRGMRSAPEALARAALGMLPGTASVAIWRDGRIVEAAVRRAQAGEQQPVAALPSEAPAPLYEYGSISKVFTGVLLAQAVERGELRLEDTLATLLGDQQRFASPAVASITLGQLVTHRACLPRQFGAVRGGPAIVQQITRATRAQLWDALAAQTLTRSPPCDHVYSNYGFAVLGELLAQRAGKPWITLVQEQITRPLGMEDTTQHLSAGMAARMAAPMHGEATGQLWDMDAFAGAGSLRGTAADLLRFGRALAQGRAGPLGAAAERVVAPLGPAAGREIGYALFLSGPPQRRTWGHEGMTGAYRALLAVSADTGDVVVSLVSNDRAPQIYAQVMIDRYPVEVPASPPVLSFEQLAPYAGVFRVREDFVLHTVVQDGRLYVRATGGIYRAYLPIGPDRFARPADGALLRFERDAATNGISSATLSRYGGDHVGRRAAEAIPDQPALVPGQAARYIGAYQIHRLLRNNLPARVIAQDDQLMVAVGDNPPQPVYRAAGAPDSFVYEKPGARLRFERDAQDRIIGFELDDNGTVLRAQRAEAAAKP